MSTDDHMETITDPAEIRATSDERGCCDCRTFDQHERECILPDERTTPAPVGAAVALDLDAIEAAALADDGWWSVPAFALVAEVRRLTEENAIIDRACVRRLDQSIAWMERADSAEAEVVTLRAKVAAVEATLHGADVTSEFLAASGDTHDAAMAGAVFAVTDNVRAALATTGEGE